MGSIIRAFFRLIRLVLTPPLLLWEWSASRPKVQRSAEAQQALDAVTGNMTLYQFKTCPFCIKTRIRIAQLALNLPTRDAQYDMEGRKELELKGGMVQVPCLHIRGNDQPDVWLYESDAIIAHLEALAV